MKHILLPLLLLLFFTTNIFAQTDTLAAIKFPTPYRTNMAIDTPLIAVEAALCGLGLYFIAHKDEITDEELAGLSKNDVNSFDRFSAGYYDPSAGSLSNIPFYASFALPLVLIANQDIRNNGTQVFTLYIEDMALTGAAYAMTVGLVDRTRPFVYKTDDPDNLQLQEDRHNKHSRNSLFSGHIATSASACFFTAKVFHDFNPGSKWEPLIWGTAIAIPLAVSYLRLEAGQHFLSDCIIGYAVGAGIGILVPELHKHKPKGLSVTPVMGPYKGLVARLTF